MKENNKKWIAALLCIALAFTCCGFHLDAKNEDKVNATDNISLTNMDAILQEAGSQGAVFVKSPLKVLVSSMHGRRISFSRYRHHLQSDVSQYILSLTVLLWLLQYMALFLSVMRFHSESEKILTYIHRKDGKKKLLFSFTY